MNDPLELFRKMLAIVGHTEKEQEELAKELYGKILAQAVLTVAGELPEDKKEKIVPLLTSGATAADILMSLRQYASDETIEKHVAAASFAIVQEYLRTIDASLSGMQKTQLSKLFVASAK